MRKLMPLSVVAAASAGVCAAASAGTESAEIGSSVAAPEKNEKDENEDQQSGIVKSKNSVVVAAHIRDLHL